MSFTYALEHEDGSPAEPPTFKTAVPTWGPRGHHSARTRPDFARDRHSLRTGAGQRSRPRRRAGLGPSQTRSTPAPLPTKETIEFAGTSLPLPP